jgi:transcriptional regulator with XRE-family HTH domain
MEPKRTSALDRAIGARVRARRASLGMSQERLGEALGITFQQVQKYERGANRISASRLHAIAAVLGAEVSFFFGERSAGGDAPDGLNAATPALRAELAALAEAFSAIADAQVRRDILNLVRSCAGRPVSERRLASPEDDLAAPP